MIVALIPAHNEQDGIVQTIRGLQAQDVRPAVIIVMADNCTDETVPRALATGAVVIKTTNNKAKKAGALNQGMALVLPYLTDSDFVLCQDADGVLEKNFIREALRTYLKRQNLGGLSGAIVARHTDNLIESAQAIEYARGQRLMSRRGGKVHVLSGAAALFRVRVLRRIAASRGSVLPGAPGTVYLEDCLTEDYELTLAIRKLDYVCSSTRRCRVVTDVMPNLPALHVQRLRWSRGAMESTWAYGFNKKTWRIWIGIFWTFFVSIMFPLSIVVLIASYLAWGTHPDLRYMILLPLFALECMLTAAHLDKRAKILAAVFVPLWIFDIYMVTIYWQALFHAVGQKSRVWIT